MTEAITYEMAKTGIHIKRANVGSVEAHNKRTKGYIEGLKKAGVNIYFFRNSHTTTEAGSILDTKGKPVSSSSKT